jgi:regulatory protein
VLADEAVAEVVEQDDVDEREAAVEAARKKVTTLGRTEPVARRRRLYAFLARRGFATDDIRAAMEIALQDVEAADDAEERDAPAGDMET